LRKVRLATAQRVHQQFDPILPPEHLPVQHIGRRTKHVGCQRILPVLLIDLADLVRFGALTRADPRVAAKSAECVFGFALRRRPESRLAANEITPFKSRI